MYNGLIRMRDKVTKTRKQSDERKLLLSAVSKEILKGELTESAFS